MAADPRHPLLADALHSIHSVRGWHAWDGKEDRWMTSPELATILMFAMDAAGLELGIRPPEPSADDQAVIARRMKTYGAPR